MYMLSMECNLQGMLSSLAIIVFNFLILPSVLCHYWELLFSKVAPFSLPSAFFFIPGAEWGGGVSLCFLYVGACSYWVSDFRMWNFFPPLFLCYSPDSSVEHWSRTLKLQNSFQWSLKYLGYVEDPMGYPTRTLLLLLICVTGQWLDLIVCEFYWAYYVFSIIY